MIRLLFLGLIACAATLGGAHLAHSLTAESGASGEPAGGAPKTLEIVETELLAANRLSEDGVSGYFLARFVLALDPKATNEHLPPIDLVLVDGFHQLVASNDMFDFGGANSVDVDRLSTELRKLVNQRMGTEALHTVLVTQVDYLGRNEVRTNSAARRATIRGELTGISGAPTRKADDH